MAAGASPAAAQDAHAEVAAVLFNASATLAAVQKSDDVKIQAAQKQVASLIAKLKAGDSRRRAEVTAAEDAFVAELSKKDAAYAKAIEAFRGSVTDIASTPQGAAALARYDSGDEVGALAVLDKIQAADELARNTVNNVQKAVGERRLANLSFDALDKGKVQASSVIARYESVVGLDPSNLEDWIILLRLYRRAGHAKDVERAANTAMRTPGERTDHEVALQEFGDFLREKGDLAGARRAHAEELVLTREDLAAAPSDPDLKRALMVALEKAGDDLLDQNDLKGARSRYEEALALAHSWNVETPHDHDGELDEAVLLADVGRVLRRLGDQTAARAALERSAAMERALLAQQSDDEPTRRQLISTLSRLDDVLKSQGDLKGRLTVYEEARRNVEHSVKADPTNQLSKLFLAEVLQTGGDIKKAGGDNPQAKALYAMSLDIMRPLAAADAADIGLQREFETQLIHWADEMRADGQDRLALAADKEALDVLGRLPDALSTDTARLFALAKSLGDIGAAFTDKKDLASARVALDARLTIGRRLLAAGPADVDRQNEFKNAASQLAGVILDQGDRTGAGALYREAAAILHRWAVENPADPALQRQYLEILLAFAQEGDMGIGWRDVLNQLQVMERRGQLKPTDQPLLAQARAHLAAAHP